MTPRTLASLLAIVVVGGHAPADDWAAFVAEYGPHHDKITAHLWRNVKVDLVRKQYDILIGGARGPYLMTVRVTAVGGADRLVYRVTQSDITLHPAHPSKPPPAGTVNESGGLMTPDAGYSFDKKAGAYTLFRVGQPWDGKGPYAYFGHLGTWSAGLSWPLYATYIERGPNRYRPDKFFLRSPRAVSRGTFRGQSVVSVESYTALMRGPAKNIIHLRLPDYLVIGSELSDFGQGNVRQAKEVVTIDYGPPQPDTGLPFPTRVTGTYFAPGQPDIVAEDVTFTEYKRYAPTADELDPVKQFGVAVPPAEPRPPLPTDAEWEAMLRPPEPAATPAPVAAPPPPAPWRHPELTAGLALVGCAVLAAVAYRRLRV